MFSMVLINADDVITCPMPDLCTKACLLWGFKSYVTSKMSHGRFTLVLKIRVLDSQKIGLKFYFENKTAWIIQVLKIKEIFSKPGLKKSYNFLLLHCCCSISVLHDTLYVPTPHRSSSRDSESWEFPWGIKASNHGLATHFEILSICTY